MSDENEYDDEDHDDEQSPAWFRKQIREVNKKLAEAETRAATNEAAARRIAFQDAKIPDTPQTKFFREKYDGEWTAEAIRAAALEHGFADNIDPAATESAQSVDAMSQAAAGAEGFPAPGDLTEMEREMDEAAAAAGPGFESAAIAEVLKRHRASIV